MDTSIYSRYLMLVAVFSIVCIIGLANLNLILRLALRRKMSRTSKIAWPALAALVVFCIVDARFIEPNWVQVTRHEITTSKLPPGRRFRIVQLTDLHMEPNTGRENRMVKLTARQKPDVIVLTGDYTNSKNQKTWSDLERIARRLTKIAPCYAIEGNWDMASDMIALRNGGVTIMHNWTTIANKRGDTIALGGAPFGYRFAPAPRSFQGMCQVMLYHKPEAFKDAARFKVDLLLVGHTHGGQVRLPIFGAVLPERSLVGRYQAGMYSNGRTTMFINRGIGMEGGAAPQVRFWCRPEVAVLDIVGMGK